jgi:hypothetical protein
VLARTEAESARKETSSARKLPRPRKMWQQRLELGQDIRWRGAGILP